MTPPRPAAIIGLGNPLMGDDGIGARVVEVLQDSPAAGPDGPEILDLGTGGLLLLHELQGRPRVVIVDAVEMGAVPGEFRVFRPEDVSPEEIGTRFSTHEGDLLRFLELSRERPSPPGDVLIAGIQTARVAPGPALSPELDFQVDLYAELVLEALETEPVCTR